MGKIVRGVLGCGLDESEQLVLASDLTNINERTAFPKFPLNSNRLCIEPNYYVGHIPCYGAPLESCNMKSENREIQTLRSAVNSTYWYEQQRRPGHSLQ